VEQITTMNRFLILLKLQKL